MALYDLTTQWSDPIALLAGDLVQLQSSGTVELQNVDHQLDPAAARMSGYLSAYPDDGDKTIRARMLKGSGTLAVLALAASDADA